MDLFGTFLIWLGIINVIFALTMGLFCNTKAHNPENEKDLEDTLHAIKLYRTILFISLGILVLGAIFKCLW